MKSIKIIIDNRKVTVPANTTVLDAAKKLNIDIPTLCTLNGYERFTSCMICVVHEAKSDRLIPACSAPVAEGMVIITNSEKVNEARKDTLDLLLSEHVGDCEAPCQRACPASMNIPQMIRQIREKNFEDAIITVKKDIALPAVLGRICLAPCENGCNRKSYDHPVSICLLKRFVADVDLAKDSHYVPELKKTSGKKVAIIGAGPTGLSAAYYIVQGGHACCVYDRNPKPGGMLRYGVSDDMLPKSVLDAEIGRIAELGVEFRQGQTLGQDIGLDEIRDTHDAVVLALGTGESNVFKNSDVEVSSRGVVVDKKTYATTARGVFSGGNAIGESRRAIRAVAHGKNIAHSVDQFLNDSLVTGIPRRFNSSMGGIREDEADEFAKGAGRFGPVLPEGGHGKGYTEGEACEESARCFHCDCRKPNSCKLRQYSEEYSANQQHYRIGERKKFQRILQHDLVIYEPGKCIKCGLCIQITRNAGEDLGLTFVNRGFEVRVEPPFNESLSQGLKKVAKECVEACPTAAIAWLDGSEE